MTYHSWAWSYNRPIIIMAAEKTEFIAPQALINIKTCEDWFKHKPQKVEECGDTTIMWDYALITDKKVGANRPDITIHDKKERKLVLVDFSIPYDTNIVEKTAEKLTKYKELEIELQKCWDLTETRTVPIIIGALGTVCTDHTQYLKLLSEKIDPNVVQKTAMLGTANILRSVLSISTDTETSKNDSRREDLGTPEHLTPPVSNI